MICCFVLFVIRVFKLKKVRIFEMFMIVRRLLRMILERGEIVKLLLVIMNISIYNYFF